MSYTQALLEGTQAGGSDTELVPLLQHPSTHTRVTHHHHQAQPMLPPPSPPRTLSTGLHTVGGSPRKLLHTFQELGSEGGCSAYRVGLRPRSVDRNEATTLKTSQNTSDVNQLSRSSYGSHQAPQAQQRRTRRPVGWNSRRWIQGCSQSLQPGLHGAPMGLLVQQGCRAPQTCAPCP